MSLQEESKNSQSEKSVSDHLPPVVNLPAEVVYDSLTEDALPPLPVEMSTTKSANRGAKMQEESKEPCQPQKKQEVETKKSRTPGLDPRFQQQNQTMRCFVMYTDFYRCENILGEGTEACQWFKEVFTSICPNEWIRRWGEYRNEGRLPWSKHDKQGIFPGDRYGV